MNATNIFSAKIADIKEYEKNPYHHSEAQVRDLAKIIKEFGFLVPVLLDKDSNLIAGHGRIAAARLLGMTEVPAVMADHLSERQVKALRIADNQIAKQAKQDFALLAEEMSSLALLDFDLTLTGFDEQSLDAFLQDNGSILPATTAASTKPAKMAKVAFEAKVKEKPKKSESDVYSVVRVVTKDEESEAMLLSFLKKHHFEVK